MPGCTLAFVRAGRAECLTLLEANKASCWVWVAVTYDGGGMGCASEPPPRCLYADQHTTPPLAVLSVEDQSEEERRRGSCFIAK